MSVATRSEIQGLITAALGGRAAEGGIRTPDQTTLIGEQDLEYASTLAESFVKHWGFGTSLQTRSLRSDATDASYEDRFSPELMRRIEREVSDLISRSLDQAATVLNEDLRGFAILTAALQERAVLLGSMINSILTEGLTAKTGRLLAADEAKTNDAA